jgi:ligand-binding sensor domain-containing protein
VVDDDNNLYIATDAGLSVYNGGRFDNYQGFSSAEPLDVARDSGNRIWILTRSGVYYFDPFYKTFQGWTFGDLGINLDFITESKEVIQIQGFTFDARRGCFWIGGSNGLLKLEIVHDDSLPLDSLIVYPNPAVEGQVVRIKNLPPDAAVSVYSVSGRCLAKEIAADPSFGEFLWRIPDGTPSGLYFALIRTARGKRIAKFAVVR